MKTFNDERERNYNHKSNFLNAFKRTCFVPAVKIFVGLLILLYGINNKNIDNWLMPFFIYFAIGEVFHGIIIYHMEKSIRGFLYYFDDFLYKKYNKKPHVFKNGISFSGGEKTSDEGYETAIKLFYKANQYLSKFLGPKERQNV